MAPIIRIVAEAREFLFDDKHPLRIGRDSRNDVRLENPYVSRYHGRLIPRDQDWLYMDLGSTRGSFVAAHRVTSFAVREDVSLCLGRPGLGAVINLCPVPISRLFISYRHTDSGHAGRLCDRLRAHFGDDQVFFDVDQMALGEDFLDRVRSAIRTCRVVLVIIGPAWVHETNAGGRRRLDDPEDPVRAELLAALEGRAKVLPVLVGGAKMPLADELPRELRRLSRHNGLSASPQHWSEEIVKLIATLDRMLSKG
jgi:hypothetical protein